MKRLLALFALMLLCLNWQTVAAQTEPLPEADYWQLVESATDTAQNEGDLDEIITQLATLETITREDGTIAQIDTGYLIALLQNDEIDHEQQAAQLNTLLATRHNVPQSLDDAVALAAFSDVISRPDFQYVSVLPDSVVRTVELLMRAIEFLFQLLEQGVENGTASIFAWVVTGLAVIGLAAFLWYWVRGVRHQFSSESELGDMGDDGELISADAAFDQAQALANSSDYRQAVRFLYLSTLLSLDEQGLLRYDRSKTNREYLHSVSGSEFSATLHSVIDVFDRVWYGFQSIDAATYEQYAGAVRRLRGA